MHENDLDRKIIRRMVNCSYLCFNKKMSGYTKPTLVNEMVKQIKEMVKGEQNDN